MISVCMATYNGEKFLRQQLDSIICQLNQNDEIIISDNGSSDNTKEIIKSYNDSRIKYYDYITDEKNKFYRVVGNFYNSLVHANGDYIFLADQDDLWDKDKVKILVSDLQKKSCVITNYSLIDANNEIIQVQKFNRNPLVNKILCIIKMPFLGCTMAFTKDFFQKYCFPFPKRLILHDLWIGLLAFCTKSMYYEEKILHKYRMHGNNVTTASKGKSKNSLLFKISYRLTLYMKVSIRIFNTK